MQSKILLILLGIAAVITGAIAYGPLLFGPDESEALAEMAPEGAPGPGIVEPLEEDGAEPSLAAGEPSPSEGAGANPASPTDAAPSAGDGSTPADEITGPKVFAGPIDRSLYQTFAGRLPRKLADPLTAVTGRLLVWWLDPSRDLRKEDSLEMLYVPGQPEPKVLALRFKSGKAGKTFEAYAFRPDAEGPMRYFDAEGVEVEARLENSPIDTYEQITSLLSDGRGHQGVDFKTPTGTPVKAPFDVTVSRVNWSTRRNGNCLDLAGPGGVHVFFLHLDKMAEGIRPGKRIKQGELVAYSGNTGRSTAPHLHYQLQKGRKILDPFEYHRTHHEKLAERYLPAFEKERKRLSALMAAR